MGGIETNPGGMRQGGRLLGRGKAPGSVVAANVGQEAAECYVKRDSGIGKGEALETRQELRGRGRQGSSGVRVRCREQLAFL